MLELLSDIVKIDESKPNFDQAKMNEIDEGYVDNNSMLLFQMKAASVYSYDLLNQRQHEIEQLKEQNKALLEEKEHLEEQNKTHLEEKEANIIAH